MRIIVDYLSDGEHYQPTNQAIIHVEAFLRMMNALRYEWLLQNLQNDNKERKVITMCGLLDKYEAKGEALFANLMQCLFKDNRISDAKLATTDIELRKQLFAEYGLNK